MHQHQQTITVHSHSSCVFDTCAVIAPSPPGTRVLSSILNEIGAPDCLQKFIDDFRDDDSLITLGKLQAGQIASRYGMAHDKAAAFIAGCRERCHDRAAKPSVQLSITSPAITLSPTLLPALPPCPNLTPLSELPPESQLPLDLPDCEGKVSKDDTFPPTQFSSTAVELIDRTQLEKVAAKDLDVPVDAQAMSSVSNESTPQSTFSIIASAPVPSAAHAAPGPQYMTVNVAYDAPLAFASPASASSQFARDWSRSKQIVFASIQVGVPLAHDNQQSLRFNFCKSMQHRLLNTQSPSTTLHSITR
jgi:hypothetical protein